jgi:hypothetical protein|tara:strand:- start:404 stop:712 length:309 start_codon:yes stop_codon:yes gene_type:complete
MFGVICLGQFSFSGEPTEFKFATTTTNVATINLGNYDTIAVANVVVATNLSTLTLASLAAITAEAVVLPTTNLVTSSVNGPGVITWNDIATGASQTWTNVET